MVADRAVRVRAKRVEPLALDRDPATAEIAARGHLRDDRRFHETRAFAETSLEIAAAVCCCWARMAASAPLSSATCWLKCSA